MADLIEKKWASVYANEDFVCFQTSSGMRRCASDPAGKTLFASLQDQPSVLGSSLVEALAASRFLRPDELASFFDVDALERRYEDWVSVLLQKFGYESRASLFRRMKHCLVDQSSGVITIRPTAHEKLEAWSGDEIEKSQYVQIPEQSSPQEIGQAILLALSRCVE